MSGYHDQSDEARDVVDEGADNAADDDETVCEHIHPALVDDGKELHHVGSVEHSITE